MTAGNGFSVPVEQVLSEQRRRWAAGDRVSVESLLAAYPDVAGNEQDILDLVYSEFCLREALGEKPDPEEYKRRFPQLAAALSQQLEVHRALDGVQPSPSAPAHHLPPEKTDNPERTRFHEERNNTGEAVPPPKDAASDHPPSIGRYQVQGVLGRGGFGIVYLGYDDQLQRPVAIKVPHARLISRPADAELYLKEARIVAALDHPNIVPVHDVGSTPEFPCFVVSRLIDGSSLAQYTRAQRPAQMELVELIATIADTLHYAHRKGIVHRDIKPSNILLDTSGKPYVVDFGLALREQELGQGPRYAGTPSYMSPEQARGEGHRVDGRSDLFSLGVVFYELLTGRRPFHAPTHEELREQISGMEARPPRQWDDTISKELERICLKCLGKRAADRYPTARDLADDLRNFLEQSTQDEKQALRSRGSTPEAAAATPPPASSTPLTPPSDSPPLGIVPKGLRSFEAQDADFFLELMPGPRDRAGLPESIRFWKTRIEENDPSSTFSVGLIYGPSGCGKSSLIKAGLLPRLSTEVIAVYVEAAAEGTESRLLHALRRRCPGLEPDLGSLRMPPTVQTATESGPDALKETLAALRLGHGLPAGKKVLIVLDQFEQWLHGRKQGDTALVQALRQCDGGRVQCLLLVRDDFWMAVTRFLGELEIDLLQGRNCAGVDLFDLDHARKVLAAFGRAFGKIPEQNKETSKQAKEFVKLAVTELAQDGKVICVRLALFAEMMKGKPWTATTLKEIGGAEGVGVTFLEDTFSAPAGNPRHRLHQRAARAVLKILLPDSAAEIKGPMRSQAELLATSGYANKPREFDSLIQILDNEIRLITPTDPEGRDEGGGMKDEKDLTSGSSLIPHPSSLCYYQLTHDYLVPSLRAWLTRKQKETRRGRAELLLADRAAVWNARPENRRLPSLFQTLQIRWLTRKKSWTAPERRMMRRAILIYSLQSLVAGLLVLLIGVWGGRSYRQATIHILGLVDTLLAAPLRDVPKVIAQMEPYRGAINPRLTEIMNSPASSRDAKLRASLALFPVDPSQTDYLYERFLDADPREGSIILDVLAVQPASTDRVLEMLQGDVTRKQGKGDNAAKRQANAAAALLRMHHPDKVWPLLKHDSDPTMRSYLVERLGPLGVDAAVLLKRLDEEPDVTIRRALVLALGEYQDSQSFPALALPRIKKLLGAEDSGLHSAAQWLLRKWKQEEALAQKTPQDLGDWIGKNAAGTGRWFINRQGQTMVVIASSQPFRMGSPPTEEGRNGDLEPQHNKRIARLFAICATPVTNQQFLRSDRAYTFRYRERSPELTCPVVGVTWFEAARYCNWLSEQDNIPRDQWCYETDKYGRVERMKPNYLALTGYRLPTEAEWEYACRAGADTSRAYGEAAELLDNYGWYLRNSDARTWPVGTKKPNDLGLFDMHGNVWNWCQDAFRLYPPDVAGTIYEDKSDPVTKVDLQWRMLRGGSYQDAARDVRCAGRSVKGPVEMLPHVGFRPARTVRLE